VVVICVYVINFHIKLLKSHHFCVPFLAVTGIVLSDFFHTIQLISMTVILKSALWVSTYISNTLTWKLCPCMLEAYSRFKLLCFFSGSVCY